jgi:hypothetical protein
MIDLTDKIEVTVVHGNTEAVVTYPSFSQLRAAIHDLLIKKLDVGSKGVKDKSADLKMQMFDIKAEQVSGFKIRQGDEVIELTSEVKDWQTFVPPNVKAASAAVFDEVTSDLVESDILGDEIEVVLDTLMGNVVFKFPPYTDSSFAAALKKFVSAERVRQRGKKFKLLGHSIDLNFVKKWCLSFEGAAQGKKKAALSELPENWLVSVPRPFVAQETLSEDELGN